MICGGVGELIVCEVMGRYNVSLYDGMHERRSRMLQCPPLERGVDKLQLLIQ